MIGGWTAPRGSREYFGALLLGLYDEERQLQFIGGVGTGFSRETQRLLWPKLQKLKTTEVSFCGAARRRGKSVLGEAGAGGAGEIFIVDAGPSFARAAIPGIAGGSAGEGLHVREGDEAGGL